MALDNPLGDRQTQSRALSPFSCREKRFKDPFQIFFSNALPRVGNAEHDVRSGVRIRIVFKKVLIRVDVRGLDGQHAACRHRVPRVDAEIEKHLLQLVHVPRNVSGLAVELPFDAYRFRQAALHDAQNLLEQPAHVQRHTLARDPPPVGHDILHQLETAASALLDRLQDRTTRLIRDLPPQQVDRHRDGRKDVLKVVRHAPRQQRDALHLLGTDEL